MHRVQTLQKAVGAIGAGVVETTSRPSSRSPSLALSSFVILFTELSGPSRDAHSPYQAEGPMREIVLSVGKQSPVPTRNGRLGLRWLLRQVVEIVEDLRSAISDPYRPERHYMRGPGPRWRAKHGTVAASAC